MERPASALSRGVKITEFKETTVNPEPISVEESEVLLEEYLSPRKLQAITGKEQLEDVTTLEMQVDTEETSLGNFGLHLPNLTQLKLSKSVIFSIRDLGTSLKNLQVLWMSQCGLEDINGVSAMSNLQELYLAYNEINDISPCSMLDKLKILDMEGNNIDEATQIEYLALCQNLTHLTLEGNPVCMTPSPDDADPDYNYRKIVKTALPQLKTLDDVPLSDISTEPQKGSSVFEDDWKLLEELMQEGTFVPNHQVPVSAMGKSESQTGAVRPMSAVRNSSTVRPASASSSSITHPNPSWKQHLGATSETSRPGTPVQTGAALFRPGTSLGRPGSSLGRPGTAAGRPSLSAGRPGSSAGRPSTAAGRPGTALINDVDDLDSMDDASDLTRGGILCGNLSRALRQRRKSPGTNNNNNNLKFVAEVQEMAVTNVLNVENNHMYMV